jgi:glutathione synthase/RimK-type ligase-like ATP-grasp enzyme
MSKRIVLIGSKDPGEKTDVNILKQAAINLNYESEISIVYWEDLFFDIRLNRQQVINLATGKDMADAQHVMAINWYRAGKQSMYKEVALSLSLYLKSKQVKFWNSEMLMQRSTSKLSAMMQLALFGYDVPDTRYCLSASGLTHNNSLSFPLIVKAAQASRGRDNYLADDQKSFEDIIGKNDSLNPYLVQEYIPNDSDLRIICMNSKPVLIIKRSRKQGSHHLNNVSMGAESELIDVKKLDPAIIQACSNICHEMGRNIAGIDLIPASDTARQVFLEVNAIPQLTSGAFVKEKTEALLSALTETSRD